MSEVSQQSRLAFKAKEIEELADVYFFRPFGMVFALAARAIGMSPTGVTLVSIVFGVAGGVLLAWPERAFVGFLLIVFYSVLDSSDGQLARMTGRSSDFGRLIDGVSGYITYVVVYLAIVTSAWSAGSGWPLVGLTALAGLSTIVHAQMYDYHRTTYVSVAVKGEPTRASIGRSYTGIVGVYESMQRAIAGRHPAVEQAIASRAYGGAVLDADRQRYRETFHWPVRGWNLFGDNTRIYAIGVLAWIGHVQWFPIVELLPMNVAFIAVWLWQQRADRRFLSV